MIEHTGLTPIETYAAQDYSAKRDDLACYAGPAYPSGAKWRQYLHMVDMSPKDAPLIVGCSAVSAMQIYVAAAGKFKGRKSVVFVPKRKERSSATKYAESMGAEIHEVPHGYLSVVRAHVRDYMAGGGNFVRWDVNTTVDDIKFQCRNVISSNLSRIVIPTGSGLIAAGVLAGLAHHCPTTQFIIVAVSLMADVDQIRSLAAFHSPDNTVDIYRARITLERAASKYDKPILGYLPNGRILDPYYAAKTLPFIKPGDLLWVPGIRPLSSMPMDILKKVK